MIARILCPGPSLARSAAELRQHGDHGTIIAVNRGSTFMPYDWLVAGDRHAYTWRLPDGRWAIDPPRRGVVTFADTARWLHARADHEARRFWGLEVHQWEDLPTCGCLLQWSLQAALLWAYSLGSREIHVYGCDHRGTQDFDGIASDGRDDDRWSREGDALTITTMWLSQRGCMVIYRYGGFSLNSVSIQS